MLKKFFNKTPCIVLALSTNKVNRTIKTNNFYFFKIKKGLSKKIKTFLNLSCLNLFIFKNTISLKKFYYFFIKYNSYKKQKNFVNLIYFFFKKIFNYLDLNGFKSSFGLKFKGKLSSIGGAKKKKSKYSKGSLYSSFGKKCFYDQKPSSSKQGCLNLSLVFKIS